MKKRKLFNINIKECSTCSDEQYVYIKTLNNTYRREGGGNWRDWCINMFGDWVWRPSARMETLYKTLTENKLNGEEL